MSNFELLTNKNEIKPTPEQIQEWKRLQKEFHGKLAEIDERLASLSPEETNEYEKQKNDRERLGEMNNVFAEALTQENLQKMYGGQESTTTEPTVVQTEVLQPVTERQIPVEEESHLDQYAAAQRNMAEDLEGGARALSQENLQRIYGKQEESVVKPVEPIEPAKVPEVNGYDKHLEDNKKLADIMGNAAQALSQENLKKIYPEEEPEAVAPVATSAPKPAKTELELVAERIREYNKNNTPLSPEDLKYRLEHWEEISPVLMELHKKEKAENPEPEVAHNFIEYGNPTLERSRNDYALALFNNRKALYENQEWKDSGKGLDTDTLDVANQQYLESLRKKYNENIDAELEKIDVGENPEGGKRLATLKARMEFVKKENEALNREMFRLENEETKKRIGKAIDKGLAKVGSFLSKSKDALKSIGESMRNAKGEGLGILYYICLAASVPIIVGSHYGNKAGDKFDEGIDLLKKKFRSLTAPYDPMKEAKEKKQSLKEKFGNKKQENLGTKPEEDTLSAPGEGKSEADIEKAKKITEATARKNEFVAKSFDNGKIEGSNKEKWERLQKLSIGAFFNPDRMSTTIAKYPAFAKKLYEKLLPLYKAEPTSKTNDRVKLGDFITKLAAQDKLKDLWTTTSNSNS